MPAVHVGDRVLSRRGRSVGVVAGVAENAISIAAGGESLWIEQGDVYSSTAGFVTLARNEEDLRHGTPPQA